MPTQLDYYIKNQDELVKQYNGKIIAVVDGACKGVFNTRLDAVLAMLDAGFKPGGYYIVLCGPGEENYTAYFNNVSFDQIKVLNR
jgi:hypothetical protein